ncbi:MAG: L,D-transpeptidase [Candidatus Daviesbacteria bacterium]|nr:L,D-transpeptidase [Candidatus Daviesbacteria bacterium]
MYRFLPILLLVVFILSLYLYLPARRLVAYKLNLDNDPTESCCDEKEVLGSTGNFDESPENAIFNSQVVDYPKTSLAQGFLTGDSSVLGETSTRDQKWIEVSLAEQKLRAWDGQNIVMEFPISSGLWNQTPKGDFRIWYKTRSQRMKGGSKELGTFYDLPNVPHNMFFYKGFAIHGAYWHNNFGQPMSHGCVNSPLSSVAELFEWTEPHLGAGTNIARSSNENPGTRVFIH